MVPCSAQRSYTVGQKSIEVASGCSGRRLRGFDSGCCNTSVRQYINTSVCEYTTSAVAAEGVAWPPSKSLQSCGFASAGASELQAGVGRHVKGYFGFDHAETARKLSLWLVRYRSGISPNRQPRPTAEVILFTGRFVYKGWALFAGCK